MKTKTSVGLITLIATLVILSIPSVAANDINYNLTNRYGGPVYVGTPALPVTAALVRAGGGVGHFSIAQALTAMVGAKLVNGEVAKLTQQYGKSNVTQWITGFNFVVEDTLQIITKAGIQLPQPANLAGKDLATTLVGAGIDPKTNVFWVGLLLDKALSHKIHNQVMDDIDAHLGAATDLNTHKLTNQAMYDLAQALGNKNLKLAPLH